MFRSVNRVIRFLITCNFFLNSAWGFLAPIFAIFIMENIVIDDPKKALEVAGFSALIFWVTKSFFQIPISQYLDRTHGEKDDFWFMVLGLFLTGISAFGFLLVSAPWHIYVLQVVRAFCLALFVPSWNAIFTRHIDKGKEAFEWAMDSSSLGFGAGIAAGMGGIIAAVVGFWAIFVLAGVLSLTAAFLLLLIQKDVLPKDHIKLPPPFKILFQSIGSNNKPRTNSRIS